MFFEIWRSKKHIALSEKKPPLEAKQKVVQNSLPETGAAPGAGTAWTTTVVFLITDFSTADLTISKDLSKLTSPCGALFLLIAAVGCVLVLAVFINIWVETVWVFGLCNSDISTSERGILRPTSGRSPGVDPMGVSLEDTSESVASSCEEAMEAAGEGDLKI